MTEGDIMNRAVVCLPSLPMSMLSETVSVLSNLKPKIIESVDEGFEHIWCNGSEIKIFILDLDESHVEELWTCARSWTDLNFIVLHKCLENLPNPLENIFIVSRKNNDLEVFRALQNVITPQVSRLIGY